MEKEIIELTKKVLLLEGEILKVKKHLFEMERNLQKNEPFRPAETITISDEFPNITISCDNISDISKHLGEEITNGNNRQI